MAQQVFGLKVWVISHGHILTEIRQKTKQNFLKKIEMLISFS